MNISNKEKLKKLLLAYHFFKDPEVFKTFYNHVKQNAAERFDYSPISNRNQKAKEFVADFIIDFVEENVKPVSFEETLDDFMRYVYFGCEHPMRSEFDRADFYYSLSKIEHAINNYDYGCE